MGAPLGNLICSLASVYSFLTAGAAAAAGTGAAGGAEDFLPSLASFSALDRAIGWWNKVVDK